MEFLDVTQHSGLVFASLLIAMVAGFTGLTLTKDLSQKTMRQRQIAIALGAVALGGGIWSMHFVAMLGLQMPIIFYYDSGLTLASALVAILIVGAALIILHFRERTPVTVTAAGGLIATGVLAMHYIGMAGLSLCRAVYTPLGLLLAVVLSFGLCIASIWVAYGRRTNRNIFLGTLCFGLAVVAVHFVAIAGTRFVAEPTGLEFGPIMSNEVLALGVMLTSFVIFGAFLWMGVTYLVPPAATQVARPQAAQAGALPAVAPKALRIPCEKDGASVFVDPATVAIVRAEGHYTYVYTKTARYFCVWPITQATRRLTDLGFIKVHRSYLINPAHVTRFERQKDKAICTFDPLELPPVPVSRSNIKRVSDALYAA